MKMFQPDTLHQLNQFGHARKNSLRQALVYILAAAYKNVATASIIQTIIYSYVFTVLQI